MSKLNKMLNYISWILKFLAVVIFTLVWYYKFQPKQLGITVTKKLPYPYGTSFMTRLFKHIFEIYINFYNSFITGNYSPLFGWKLVAILLLIVVYVLIKKIKYTKKWWLLFFYLKLIENFSRLINLFCRLYAIVTSTVSFLVLVTGTLILIYVNIENSIYITLSTVLSISLIPFIWQEIVRKQNASKEERLYWELYDIVDQLFLNIKNLSVSNWNIEDEISFIKYLRSHKSDSRIQFFRIWKPSPTIDKLSDLTKAIYESKKRIDICMNTYSSISSDSVFQDMRELQRICNHSYFRKNTKINDIKNISLFCTELIELMIVIIRMKMRWSYYHESYYFKFLIYFFKNAEKNDQNCCNLDKIISENTSISSLRIEAGYKFDQELGNFIANILLSKNMDLEHEDLQVVYNYYRLMENFRLQRIVKDYNEKLSLPKQARNGRKAAYVRTYLDKSVPVDGIGKRSILTQTFSFQVPEIIGEILKRKFKINQSNLF